MTDAHAPNPEHVYRNREDAVAAGDAEAARDALNQRAYDMGREAGEAAASWYFDGNTTRATYERVLAGIQDGDPAIYDTFPQCPLSGEWADDPTPGDVLRSLGVDEYDDANDELLRMYEDGFGVAVSEAIEREALDALRDARWVARQMAGRFTTRTRDDGTRYVCLTDAAEEWMRDVVREAHGDMLPDDWRYDAIASAVEFIAENEDYDDRRDEWADGMVDVYDSALVEWYASHAARAGYVMAARDEWQDPDASVSEWFQRGQFFELCEVFELVERALDERV